MAANMLSAYYSQGCDSTELFAKYKIARDVVPYIQKHVFRELTDEYPDILTDQGFSLAETLALISEKGGHRFVIIIDEWDSIIRDDTEDTAAHGIYINFLRSLLNRNLPSGYLCLAYLTGILPIYNPRAVVSSIKSYWSQTGSYEVAAQLINMNFDGLKSAVIHMLSGEALRINTKSYQNDMVSFRNKDDVLTLLIHLGYLGYEEETSRAFIPNEEIRSEFVEAVEEIY